jgi:hypothetical protein
MELFQRRKKWRIIGFRYACGTQIKLTPENFNIGTNLFFLPQGDGWTLTFNMADFEARMEAVQNNL